MLTSLEPTKHHHHNTVTESFHRITSLWVFQAKFSTTAIRTSASFKGGYFLLMTSVSVEYRRQLSGQD